MVTSAAPLMAITTVQRVNTTVMEDMSPEGCRLVSASLTAAGAEALPSASVSTESQIRGKSSHTIKPI